jgi:hypothetical protein
MQCEIRRTSRSCGLDTVFRYAPDLLGRRSLPYPTDIVSSPFSAFLFGLAVEVATNRVSLLHLNHHRVYL